MEVSQISTSLQATVVNVYAGHQPTHHLLAAAASLVIHVAPGSHPHLEMTSLSVQGRSRIRTWPRSSSSWMCIHNPKNPGTGWRRRARGSGQRRRRRRRSRRRRGRRRRGARQRRAWPARRGSPGRRGPRKAGGGARRRPAEKAGGAVSGGRPSCAAAAPTGLPVRVVYVSGGGEVRRPWTG
uniref:Uncharacterized protein n=1 Tax=Arundo donax TaxID=35708 RepID=A0A0A9DL20_ARUDO